MDFDFYEYDESATSRYRARLRESLERELRNYPLVQREDLIDDHVMRNLRITPPRVPKPVMQMIRISV